MYDIIAIGSCTRDVLLGAQGYKRITTPEFPVGQGLCFGFGSKVEISKIVMTTGGGGNNAAVTFARQGMATACVGVIGNDSNGQDVLAALQAEGVDTDFFQKHGDGVTAYSTILVDPSGERTILSYKGEGQHFNASLIPFDRLQARWLYLDSLGGHFDMLEMSVQWAMANGVKLATNPGGKELTHGLEKLRPLLQHFSVVMMNQEEAAGFAGISYENEAELFATMDDLISGVFVMTKGPQGVVVSDGRQVYRAGIPDSPVVERTGAGDAFNSGFLAEYIRSGDISKAIQFGTANASSVVTQYGATPGILKKGDWGSWPLVQVDVSSK